MKNIVKKLLAIVLTTTTILSATCVYATDDTRSVASSFDSSNLEYTIVTMPQNLNLSYDSVNNVYLTTKKVKAVGLVSSEKSLSISVPTSIQYSFATKADVKLPATVTFGTAGVSIWSAEQLATDTDERDVNIVMSDISNIRYFGEYNATIVFTIAITTN